MQEKPKRGERPSKLILILLLAAALLSSFLYSSLSSKPYATQEWVNPRLICTTYWMMVGEDETLKQYILENVPDSNTSYRIRSISRFGSRVSCPDGNNYYGLEMNFVVDATIGANTVTFGNFIAELFIALDEAGYEGTDLVEISFEEPEFGTSYWWLSADEAIRAVKAGVRGAELWAIGQ